MTDIEDLVGGRERAAHVFDPDERSEADPEVARRIAVAGDQVGLALLRLALLAGRILQRPDATASNLDRHLLRPAQTHHNHIPTHHNHISTHHNHITTTWFQISGTSGGTRGAADAECMILHWVIAVRCYERVHSVLWLGGADAQCQARRTSATHSSAASASLWTQEACCTRVAAVA